MAICPTFSPDFQNQLHALLRWRRDVRKFRRGPMEKDRIERLLNLARLAPSVGLSEPWRFVIVSDELRRAAIRRNFEQCNQEALKRQSPGRAHLYARLKLAGLEDAPCHIAVFADASTKQGHGLGRGTMPQTLEYSVVAAVHSLWLAARAEGIGLGWVSILDPRQITEDLDVPSDWTFIAYLCLGYPAEESETPALELEGWEQRRPLENFCLQR